MARGEQHSHANGVQKRRRNASYSTMLLSLHVFLPVPEPMIESSKTRWPCLAAWLIRFPCPRNNSREGRAKQSPGLMTQQNLHTCPWARQRAGRGPDVWLGGQSHLWLVGAGTVPAEYSPRGDNRDRRSRRLVSQAFSRLAAKTLSWRGERLISRQILSRQARSLARVYQGRSTCWKAWVLTGLNAVWNAERSRLPIPG
jgi:hypothetical protein